MSTQVKKHNSVSGLVTKDLVLKLEQGMTSAQIDTMSKNTIDTYTSYFRATYAHQLGYAFADGTVNRCVEQWLKYRRGLGSI